MSRQDKATTDRFTKTLRELVKRADNKVCADCKRNDPRWASWNLGVFLCIRCSGIHRGMGTHISKVKSVDLDTWTPEQMQSIQKWGNRLANLYWEAHLKQGHQPPDHKMESFIRSKYESRRWALDGPPPPDPSVLDSEAGVSAEPSAEAAPAPSTAPDPIGWGTPSPPHASNSTVSKQPQARQLLSAGHAPNTRTTAPLVKPPPGQHAAAPAPAPAPPAPQEDLFSLDFHAPAASASPPPAPKNAKQDILSLFSTPAAAAPQMASPPFGQFQQQPSPWAQQQQQPAQMQTQSMMGSNGTGMWGASSGWSAPQQAPQQQSNLWGAPAQQQSPFGSVPDTNNVWGGMVSAGGGSGNNANANNNTDLFSTPAAPPPQKKDDAFGDLWGGFK